MAPALRELEQAGTPLVTDFDADKLPPHGTGQLLAPWPNRVADGRYYLRRRRYQLALSEPAKDNAIHGLTRWMRWGRASPMTAAR